MTRVRNSAADSKGGSTFVDAGSIPAGSTIHERRAQAARVVAGLSPLAIRNMAYKHMKSDVWVRRYLRHCAYWMPGSLLYAAAKTGDLPAPTGARDDG